MLSPISAGITDSNFGLKQEVALGNQSIGFHFQDVGFRINFSSLLDACEGGSSFHSTSFATQPCRFNPHATDLFQSLGDLDV